MGSSKKSRSHSPEDSVHRSKSHHRSRKSRSSDKHGHEVSNNTSPLVLNELLEKLTQMASSLATLDNRLGVFESNQRNQTERSNEQTALEQDDSVYCHSSGKENSEYLRCR